jgi:hypothetical protein
MGLMDRLRKAEEQGKEAARHAIDRAREVREDAQRRIRQKMRIYPVQTTGSAPSEVSQANSMAGLPAADGEADLGEDLRHLEANQNNQPIISINGRDLERAGQNEGKRRMA